MNHCWWRVYPDAVYDFTGFEEAPIRNELVEHVKEVGFDEVEVDDVTEFLESHRQPLTNEDFAELDKQMFNEESMDDDDDDDSRLLKREKGLTTKVLHYVFNLAEQMFEISSAQGNLQDRSAKVA